MTSSINHPNVKLSPEIINPTQSFTEIIELITTQQNGKSFKSSKERARALQAHINNASNSLVWGLENIGHLLTAAANTSEIDGRCISNTGHFIQTLANIFNALSDLRSEVN